MSESERHGTQSSTQGVVPSHPIDLNESDVDDASRSVSPQPLTQKKGAARHTPGEGTATSAV